MTYTTYSLEGTTKLATRFIAVVSLDPSRAVFGLSGDLGSGKTAFTQSVARHLGITSHVTSPTFVIQKKYPILLPGFPFKTLIHIDAYRLENAQELETLGFKRELEDPTNLILIEWPERVMEILPPGIPILRFTFVSPHVRTIEFPDMMAA